MTFVSLALIQFLKAYNSRLVSGPLDVNRRSPFTHSGSWLRRRHDEYCLSGVIDAHTNNVATALTGSAPLQ